MEPVWVQLGLQPMRSDVSSSVGSASSWSSVQPLWWGRGYNMHVSSTRLHRGGVGSHGESSSSEFPVTDTATESLRDSEDSGFGTDVSEWQRLRRRVQGQGQGYSIGVPERLKAL